MKKGETMGSLSRETFVIIDVETTGLSPQYGDRVVEVAALKCCGKKIIAKFEALIDPQRRIPYEVSMIHGITAEMVEGEPVFGEIASEFMAFIKGSCLVGHNVKFDIKFLNNELELAGWPLIDNTTVLDTIKMAKGLIPAKEKYSLERVAQYLHIIKPQVHRAMSDVEITYDVLCKLLDIAAGRGLDQMAQSQIIFGADKLKKQYKTKKMASINAAMEDRGSVKILYLSPRYGAFYKEVYPVEVKGLGRDMELVARCCLTNGEASYEIDRVIQIDRG